MTAKHAYAGAALQHVLPDDRRETDRYPVALQTTCQPPSAWRKDPWPATIRDISTGGLSLSLDRRFERGSGLAIELPGEDGSTSTVLARVTFLRPQPEGGWMLGCTFISELSQEEVQTVLELNQLQNATASVQEIDEASDQVAAVLFQARLRTGEVARWFIKHLDLASTWPLEKGKVVSLQLGGVPAGTPPLELTVKTCNAVGACWIVNCKFTTPPHEEVLRAIGCVR